MKRFVILICVISVGLSVSTFFLGRYTKENQNKNYYPLTGIVVNVSRANDTVTIEDSNGNYWQFTGAEDWEENDFCSCIMNDNGTKEIKDDKIVKVRYCGGWSE